MIYPISRYYKRRAIALALLLAAGVYLYVTVPGNWRMRPAVQGSWIAIPAQPDVWSITIAPNGIVSGRRGTMQFYNTVVLDARGTWERMANARPIYAMAGYLRLDSAMVAIRMPLQVGNDTLHGMFFTETAGRQDSSAVVLVRPKTK